MSDRIQEVAERANVPEDFVRQLVAAGALPGEEDEVGSRGAVRRARLLWSWTAAGLSVETVLALIDKGSLSLAFLDAPVMDSAERLDRSYEQLAAERDVPMSFVRRYTNRSALPLQSPVIGLARTTRPRLRWQRCLGPRE